jgi:N-acetylmuramoyl-L-alanine amidase
VCLVLAIVLAAAATLPHLRPRIVRHRSQPPVRTVLARAAPPAGAGPGGRGGPIPFRPDACLRFEPRVPWNGATVFVDPGHGGADPGAMRRLGGRLVTEKQVTLGVGLRAVGLLLSSGYRVVLSRLADTTVASFGSSDLHQGLLTPDAAQREIEARNLCANAAHADVLVALHMNSFADPSAHGSETLYCPARPFASRSRRLAEVTQRAMLAAVRSAGIRAFDRGVLQDREAGGAPLTPQTANYHHLIELGPADPPWLPDPSLMPGVLVEPAFLSNPAEASFALSRRGQAALAHAVVDALDTYFGKPRQV